MFDSPVDFGRTLIEPRAHRSALKVTGDQHPGQARIDPQRIGRPSNNQQTNKAQNGAESHLHSCETCNALRLQWETDELLFTIFYDFGNFLCKVSPNHKRLTLILLICYFESQLQFYHWSSPGSNEFDKILKKNGNFFLQVCFIFDQITDDSSLEAKLRNARCWLV